MTDRLSIDGWMVAEANLEHGYAPDTNVDRVFVFRNPGYSVTEHGAHVDWDRLTNGPPVEHRGRRRPHRPRLRHSRTSRGGLPPALTGIAVDVVKAVA